jgi:hypothetical protein
MPYDYSNTPSSNLIPASTLATVLMRILPGGVGEGQLLVRSKEGDCEMLRIEYVVVDGPYSRRKIFENQIIVGTTQPQQDMAASYRSKRKAILQSARGIKESDTSPEARAKYQADLKDFDGLNFIAKIGIEKGKGGYPDKNTVTPVTPDNQKDWHPIVQTPPFNGDGAGATAAPPASSESSSASTNPPIEPPTWAR